MLNLGGLWLFFVLYMNHIFLDNIFISIRIFIIMKKHLLSILFLLLALPFLSTNSFATDSLIGHWANKKIKLNLRANHKYTYVVKILGINKTFKGRWSATSNKLTLKYTLLGEHKKTAKYSFSRGDLLLTQGGKTSRLKKK